MTSHTEVVISGLSGRFPESSSVQEFRDNLFNRVDMVTEDGRRWQPGLHGIPPRQGKLKDIDRFDAAFFGIAPIQAENMDPQLRLLFEVSYEALVDAGVSPQSIRGSATGVFVGASFSESHHTLGSDMENVSCYSLTGCCMSMFANRLSYFYDLKGPSFVVDTACSSSLLALDQALQSIRDGRCNAAIVAGTHVCLQPALSLQFNKLNVLAGDGACRSFDANGSGYVRSEAIVAIYLQKQQDAHRIYATVTHARSNSDGYTENGVTFPSKRMQNELLEDVYAECEVEPADVFYVEAHGTGTKAGDKQELDAIADVFCNSRRTEPLLIGSTKSNMGHPEPASGLAAVAKVLIAMEEKSLPANLHYVTPNPDISALTDGRLQVVNKHWPFTGQYVGVNSFGFGGSNVHVILKANTECRDEPKAATDKARLFVCSARTQQGLEKVLKSMQEKSDDVGMQALLQSNAHSSALNHPYRGFVVLNANQSMQEVKRCPATRRPVWFIFSGMGTQWPGMGRDMMHIKVFRESVEKSDAVLKIHGVELTQMITGGTGVSCDNIINSFVCITAIQVALVDVLRCIGVEPDGIVGHSIGELACAYAGGSLTAEEAVLASYWRGRCILDAKLPIGAMAAVGLTWEEANERCPKGIVPACHNAKDNVTISGPAEKVKEFIEQLRKEDVFAKEVNSAGIAFHCYFLQKVAPLLHKALTQIIKEPMPRSSRWISSSVPEKAWQSDLALTCSPDYLVNNLLSPVLFYEALQHVPTDAITIEIGPHCLLKALLRRSLGKTCTLIALMKKRHQDNSLFLMENLGKLYSAGVDVDPLSLHEPAVFPVARGTPMLSPLVEWDHSQSWPIFTAESNSSTKKNQSGSQSVTYVIDTTPSGKDQYLMEHKIDGRALYPAVGYCVLAWRTLAQMHGVLCEDMPVCFEDLYFHEATLLSDKATVTLHVSIQPGTGTFEVRSDSGTVLVTGKIHRGSKVENRVTHETLSKRKIFNECNDFDLPLKAKDVYDELRLRGYEYGPAFQNILSSDNKGTKGTLRWTDEWISHLDALLHCDTMSKEEKRQLRVPQRIHYIAIDPQTTKRSIETSKEIPYEVLTALDTVMTESVTLRRVHYSVIFRHKHPQSPILQHHVFVPYNQRVEIPQGKAYIEECIRLITEHAHLIPNHSHKQPQREMKELIGLFMETKPISLSYSSKQNRANSLGNDNETCPKMLLSVLNKIFLQNNNDFHDNLSDILAIHNNTELCDFVFECLQEPAVLKSHLQTVIENRKLESKSGQTVKIVEYGAGRFCKKVLPLLQNEPLVDVEAIVVREKEGKNEHENTESDLSVRYWDYAGNIPTDLPFADLIIMDEVAFDDRFAHRIDVIYDSIQSGGFALLYGATNNHTLALIAHALMNNGSLPGNTRATSRIMYDETAVLKLISDINLKVVSQATTGLLHSMFLCRKLEAKHSMRPDIDINVTSLHPTWVNDIKAELLKNKKIWLRSSTPYSGVYGLTSCLRKEPNGINIRSIMAEDEAASQEEIDKQKALDLVVNIYCQGSWGHYVQMPVQAENHVTTEYAYVDMLSVGNLQWVESQLKRFETDLTPVIELCTVFYSALNFRDVMLATGKLSPSAIPGHVGTEDCMLGMEFSGKDQSGRNVMGIVRAKALATNVAVKKKYMWAVPSRWTLRDAASVPVAYCTAYYALVVRGRIRSGDTVLIHAGSGGVGQAAITIALHYGCRVFTTVGSDKKVEFLKQKFPQLVDNSFAHSRDTSFEQHIMNATNGRGCDVILNSLADEKLQASLRCLATGGTFLEIGKYDLAKNTALGMELFLKNVTIHGVLLDALFDDNARDWDEIHMLLTTGIESGVVKPLNTTVFSTKEVEKAFRFMTQGTHTGKVLIQVKTEKNSVHKDARGESYNIQKIPAIPRVYFYPTKSYIVTGGLGGFGLQLTQWLIDRGAKHILLTSRSGVKTGYQSRRLRLWRENPEVNIVVSRHNVSSHDQTEELIHKALSIAPVGGVFHLAMVLRDGLLENQTVENFVQVFQPKVNGVIHLDAVTRSLCLKSLDWFVAFSSFIAWVGNEGQSNYAFANSCVETVCQRRRQDGFPGLAIEWGGVGDIGATIDELGDYNAVIAGSTPQPIRSCLATLDDLLIESGAVITSYVLAKAAESKYSVRNAERDIVELTMHVLGISDITSVDHTATLSELGLDSLMGVEVRQVIQQVADINMPLKEIQSLTFSTLAHLNSNTSSFGETPTDEDVVTMSLESRMVMRQILRENLIPSEPIVKMKTKPGNNVDRPTLFLVHDVSGTIAILKDMVTLLDLEVYGLQVIPDYPANNLTDLARCHIQQIKTVEPAGPYNIAGYCYGATLATEIVRQLVDNGDGIASVTFLDGSPQQIARTRDIFIKDVTDKAEMETKVMCNFASIAADTELFSLKKLLLAQPNRRARSEACAQYITQVSSLSNRTQIAKACEMYYDKLIMSYEYVPRIDEPINMNVVLIRNTQGQTGAARLNQVLGLDEFFSSVSLHRIEGDHVSIIRGHSASEVAEIINNNTAKITVNRQYNISN